MKKYVLALALTLTALSASAQHHHHHHGEWRRGDSGNWNWVVPALIGGALVYGATRPETVVVQQPPVVVQNPPPVYTQNCTAWVETMQPNGTITRTRTCNQ